MNWKNERKLVKWKNLAEMILAGVAAEKSIKKCHIDFDEKIEEFEGAGHIVPSHEILKNAEQIEKIKESAKINIAVLDYVAEHIGPGVTTQQIDDWVYEQTTSLVQSLLH
mgnify:CR=1 FL=1